jgi:hypothetical protein
MRASIAVLAIGIAVLAHAGPAAAQNCPSAQSGVTGFVVERGDRSKTEVFHVEDTDVRTVFRNGGRTYLETTQFQGLFDLERIDRGRRMIFNPCRICQPPTRPMLGRRFPPSLKSWRARGARIVQSCWM